jgi:hypothetical protein
VGCVCVVVSVVCGVGGGVCVVVGVVCVWCRESVWCVC